MDTDLRTWIGQHGWKVALLSAAAGVTCAVIVGRLVADPDLWGHVRFGQLILTEGLPEFDPYAYTSTDHPWINHEILSEVAFGWTYARFGPFGLQMLRYGLIGAIVLVVWRELETGGLRTENAVLGTAWVVFGMSAGLATIRPHLFTYLFFSLVLVCLPRTQSSYPRRIWLVPVIVGIWTNFHGGVLAGVGVVGLWWTGEAFETVARRDRGGVPFSHATLLLLGCLLALALNPYGWDLPIFLVDTATEARPFIMEWQSVAEEPAALALWTAFTGSALAVLFWRRPALRPGDALILGCLALLPLDASRHMPLYALGWGVLLAPHLPDVWGWARRWRRERRAGGLLRILPEAVVSAALLLVAAGGVVVTVERGSTSCIPLPSEQPGHHAIRPVPREAVRLLARSGVSGNLATRFNWGEYAIWHLGPRVQVGMDGRRETVYPDSVYRAYNSFRLGRDDWYRWLDQYGADLALVAAGSPPDNLLSLKAGWRAVHRNDLSVLYGRVGWAGTRRIAATRSDDVDGRQPRCFPDGPPAPPSDGSARDQ